MPSRPSTDRTRPGYFRRPWHVLNLQRLAGATAADLPVIREALALECACKRPRAKLTVAFVLRISELAHP